MDSHGTLACRATATANVHYGRDDFADRSKLVRTLSRERGKDMASDYKPEQQFAERRGITFRERIVEIARQLPERAKSIFAGFRPQAQKLEVLPTEQTGLSDPRRAIERYARAAADIGQMREQNLPILPHQRDALESREGSRHNPAHAAADLVSAMQRQPESWRARPPMAALQGAMRHAASRNPRRSGAARRPVRQ